MPNVNIKSGALKYQQACICLVKIYDYTLQSRHPEQRTDASAPIKASLKLRPRSGARRVRVGTRRPPCARSAGSLIDATLRSSSGTPATVIVTHSKDVIWTRKCAPRSLRQSFVCLPASRRRAVGYLTGCSLHPRVVRSPLDPLVERVRLLREETRVRQFK